MGLHENMIQEPVSSLSLRSPVTCAPDTKLADVIAQMRAGQLGCAIVVDADGRAVGMFTESMLTQIIANGTIRPEDPVQEHMSERFPWVRDTDPVVDVLDAMQTKNVRFLCVLDDKDAVVGVTGQKGLMEYVADHFPGQVMVQRVGLAPYLSREGA